MAHRSNQAVASQEPADTPPQDPPPRRRVLIGLATALAALGISIMLLGGGLWLARFYIAELLIGAALGERGLEADFEVVALDFNHAVLNGVRFGAETAPDAAIASVEARWGWRGAVPQLQALRIIEPRLRLRLDAQGRLSAGALDRIETRPRAERGAIPALELEILDGRALVDAPFGALEASFSGQGRLGEDFTASARIAETTRRARDYALARGGAELTIVSREDALALQVYANAAELRWNELTLDGADVRVTAHAPLDLSSYAAEIAWRADRLQTARVDARGMAGVLSGEGRARDDRLEPRTWRANAGIAADRLAYADMALTAPRLDARAEGGAGAGDGAWTLAAQRFDGLAMHSARPSARGGLTLGQDDGWTLRGDANVSLSETRLDARAQQRVRAALPDLPQAPIGPTFAAAEAALDRAADRFELSIPIRFSANRHGAQITAQAAAEARAASGARVRLAPLRQDAPALRLETPALLLQGAVALELSGGGAPNATLLLDAISWSPQAPFEADGTLTLSNWRNQNASIAADELGVSMIVRRDGTGQVEARGPVRITGPLGDGQVRDLTAQLDLAAHWGQGWRVAPTRPCLPMRLGGLDAAGLSFQAGRFELCALDGALISADARGRLGGGFAVQALNLSGRMAGPDGQPARLGAQRVTGRFGGMGGDVRLTMEAQAPTLNIVLSEARTLSLVMARLTAEASIDQSWRVQGRFERGGLSDPALPGVVSAIAGRWSAAPEQGRPVIRVLAAQALLQANRPASDAERLLFNPIELVGVDATLREGRIDAEGAVLLDAGDQRLARFTARHDVSEGAGRADIDAPDIMFGESLQPYHVSEHARGVVDNVRGPASAQASVSWTREQISTAAFVRLKGVSLASATIPVIENVRGEIVFDDLAGLTTPPGQQVSVGLLNPGVAVQNGRVRFQLRQGGVIAIEQAEFDFAGGVLAMRPEVITLGADQTEIELYLRDVDATALIQTLNVPDLQATGRIEGSFPLRLTRRSAIVSNGLLSAAGGGRIAYTGGAGEHTEGVTRVAFDALRDFRYQALSLTLNGDLNGEVVSDISFTGENAGEPIDLTPIASLPGLGRVTMVGVPFRFNVKVTAPFRRLADTAAAIINPGSLINRRSTGEVDQQGQGPR